MVKEIDKYKSDSCVLQEIRWSGKGTVMKENSMILYIGHKTDGHECGTGFYISRHVIDSLFDFEPVNERILKLRLNVNITILHFVSTHAPTDGKDEVDKEECYSSLEKLCDAVLSYDMKTVLGDFKTKVGKKPIYIQHVEGTTFTTIIIMIMEKNGKFCAGKR